MAAATPALARMTVVTIWLSISDRGPMEAAEYKSLLERLEAEMPVWPPSECLQVLGILERLRASAWARILGGSLSAKTTSQQEGGKLLTLPEVAARLAVPETYAYGTGSAKQIASCPVGQIRESACRRIREMGRAAGLPRTTD